MLSEQPEASIGSPASTTTDAHKHKHMQGNASSKTLLVKGPWPPGFTGSTQDSFAKNASSLCARGLKEKKIFLFFYKQSLVQVGYLLF